MADQPSTQHELEEELTAYLDGELDAAGVRRVEERLARDAAYRAQLQTLERTWGLLDRLPRASVGEEFTKSTLEMVAVSAAADAAAVQSNVPRVRQRQRLAGAISMAAALLVGFAIGNQVWPDPNESLLRDLPVLENLDLYYQADDIEFLRMLDKKHLFDDGDSDPAGSLLVPAVAGDSSSDPLTSAELAARRARIAAMAPEKQQDLLRKFERFGSLPEEEQQRLRALQAGITADPNSERLLLVLERYHEWLKTINTTQRARLGEMAVKERIKAIEDLRRTQRDAQRLEPLTRDDMRDIRRWVDELVEVHRGALEASIPSRYRDWYNRQSDPSAKQMALTFRLFGSSRGGEEESKVTQQDLDRLTQKLSESAQAELAKAGTLEEQRQLVRGWIFASLRRSSEWRGGRRNNPVVGEELLQFLQTEVPPAERERLLQKPREEMLQELRKMYFERSGGPSRGTFDGRSDRDRSDHPRPDYRRGRPDGPRNDKPPEPEAKPAPSS